jgi:SAM-dependent methyltransferase
MSKNKIIQDYGETVTPELYKKALQGHQYIPQADQCIMDIVFKKYNDPPFEGKLSLLDVGCGPNRLTSRIADIIVGSEVAGIDVSESFIKFSKENLPCLRTGPGYLRKNPTFFQLDFSNANELEALKEIRPFDMVVMQGVMHHIIHGNDRVSFIRNAYNYLFSTGILIIGDEFIADYDSDQTRKDNIAKFYCHIIDEARKGGFNELAEEEAKNFIDDYFSGTEHAGYGDGKVFECIYEFSEKINTEFYTRGIFGDFSKLIDLMEKNVIRLTETLDSNTPSFNRGDYKVSINELVKELTPYGFTLVEKYEIGPVKQLGGMGVLVFRKH